MHIHCHCYRLWLYSQPSSDRSIVISQKCLFLQTTARKTTGEKKLHVLSCKAEGPADSLYLLCWRDGGDGNGPLRPTPQQENFILLIPEGQLGVDDVTALVLCLPYKDMLHFYLVWLLSDGSSCKIEITSPQHQWSLFLLSPSQMDGNDTEDSCK